MLFQIYSIISTTVLILLGIFVGALLLRLIFSFTDPNPFGAVGRFGYQIRKRTEKFVYPAARLLAQFRIDTRYAPLVTILITCVLAYFALQIIGNTFFILDGISKGIITGNPKAVFGFILYAALSVYVLFIFIRFISSWFVFTRNTFLGFVQRVTDPVLLPLRKLIAPIGMIDLSAMILLLVIGFVQSLILKIFVYS